MLAQEAAALGGKCHFTKLNAFRCNDNFCLVVKTVAAAAEIVVPVENEFSNDKENGQHLADLTPKRTDRNDRTTGNVCVLVLLASGRHLLKWAMFGSARSHCSRGNSANSSSTGYVNAYLMPPGRPTSPSPQFFTQI